MKRITNFKAQMSNQIQISNEGNVKKSPKYDLQERTARFGEILIEFIKSIPDTTITRPLITQTIRSGTNIGANYMEADGAESKKDFIHKIKLCKKEAKETMHWLRMMAKACPSNRVTYNLLRKEAHELTLIFSAIARNTKLNPF